LKRSAFRRVDGIHQRLTLERLREAQREMSETGETTDEPSFRLLNINTLTQLLKLILRLVSGKEAVGRPGLGAGMFDLSDSGGNPVGLSSWNLSLVRLFQALLFFALSS
jgi:hypothetical protein